MTTPFHHKKPFDPSGDVYANSVTRTMKSQSLSAWDMFTRETLQNSWDARDQTSHEDGVTFAMEYRDLNPEQVVSLDHNVFGGDYDGLPLLEQRIRSGKLSALVVSDTGTHGLRGPSSARAAVDGPTDFNAFIRNIGRSDTKALAGGTYGFGKGVFFIASEVDTIVVYTRTVDENNQRVNRLIAVANADDFQSEDISYTGRHWWGLQSFSSAGEEDRTEYAEPFEGAYADQVAQALGLDTYFSDEQPTGTTIMVLQPDINESDEESFDQAPEYAIMKHISASLTRWAWPHMLDIETGLDPIEFKVKVNGEEVPVIHPEDDVALHSFSQAYLRAFHITPTTSNTWKSDFMGRVARLETERPRQKLGQLSLVDLRDSVPDYRTVLDQEISSHIATIRVPRMVVEYYKAPSSDSGRPFCGVFIASDNADKVFARSEPAAHHQWNFETIKHDHQLLADFWGSKSTHNPVRIFWTKLRDLTRNQTDLRARSGEEKHYKAISKLSEGLGSFLSNAAGGTSNKSTFKPKKRKQQNPKSRVLKPVSSSRLVDLTLCENGSIALFEIEVKVPPKQLPIRVSPEVSVSSDKGDILSALRDTGQPVPYIIEVHDSRPSEASALLSTDVEYSYDWIEYNTESIFYVEVFQPNGTAISVDASFELLESAESEGDQSNE